MSTALQLAQAIETQFTFGGVVTLSICRPNMTTPLAAGNLPYVHALNDAAEQAATGVIQNEFWALIRTVEDNSYDLIKGITFNQAYGTTTVFITAAAKAILDNVLSVNHPAGTEFNGLWTAIVAHLVNTRQALEPTIQRIRFMNTTPVYGRVGCMVAESGRLYWRTFSISATYSGTWTITSVQQV
jgi:hypothetical protein